MTHPLGVSRAWTSVIASVIALSVLALTAIPAGATAVTQSKGIAQKGRPAAAVQHLGGVNSAQRHEFSVILKTKTRADAELVAAYFKRFGMLARIASNNRSLHVTGTFGSSAAAANVRFERVKIGSESFTRTTSSPQFPPQIGSRIAATSISPGVRMRSLAVRPQFLVAGPQTGYGPGDFARIYDILPVYASGINGRGTTVDIAACNNIDPKDIRFFEDFYGLPHTIVHVIHVDGTTDQFGNVPPSDLEPTNDVERVIATAPGATVNLYVVPDCFTSQFVDMFEQIADDGHAVSMSVSYGLPEADYAVFGIAEDLFGQSKALEEIQDENITSFAASGDNGSWGDSLATGLVNILDVSYPASDPTVLSVGGTTVEQTLLGTRLFEYAWGGSGGGYSGIFPIPPWQSHTPGVASGLFKNVPDVAFDADPNTGAAVAWIVSLPPPIFPVGGTSISSPTWAAILALVNQNRRSRHSTDLTNVPRALYALQGTSAYYDITVGANGYFRAKPGYDNVTGLGVPNVAKLVKALQ
ncbi:MAG: hypothetical protein DLM63_04280 [Solirubrobacterales bacterium]|nr:S8 family serine peptidase [Candidatus Eremiobacteraeota bacterium]PZR68239.1 MAG: hypothetical protein DLM63_04280 [Solirubrobacterales bacterium]